VPLSLRWLWRSYCFRGCGTVLSGVSETSATDIFMVSRAWLRAVIRRYLIRFNRGRHKKLELNSRDMILFNRPVDVCTFRTRYYSDCMFARTLSRSGWLSVGCLFRNNSLDLSSMFVFIRGLFNGAVSTLMCITSTRGISQQSPGFKPS
jgi:hypothetical protein